MHRQLLLTVAALSTLLLSSFVISNAIAAPNGPYLVGEAGISYVNDNYLEGLNPFYSGSTAYASPNKTTRAQMNERVAMGDYFTHPDSVTAIGLELGYNYFNQLNSNTSTIMNGQTVNGKEQSNAWSTTFEGVASFDVATATEFFVKFGMGYANITRNTNLTSSNAITLQPGTNTDKSSGLGISGGLGLQFTLTKNIGLRFESDGFAGTDRLSYAQALGGLVFGFSV